MRYISTRGGVESVQFSTAVEQGLAPDGGLYVPEKLPDLSGYLNSWKDLDYADLCGEFFSLFATDIPKAELKATMASVYRRFSDPSVAPIQTLNRSTFVLELFHGPTLAFKDFALQVLGQLYERQIQIQQAPLNVLGATSGDTGAAAIHGLQGKAGIHTFILFPEGRISPLQERQMTCTRDPRVFPLAIQGSFDDAQAALKALFGDQDFRKRNRLSAVNSINLARILAQCVYYLWAWLRLPPELRKNMEVVVPTGNFGNVFAGWLLSEMGVPWKRFRIATNQNDILFRLFETGVYEKDQVSPSLAPSMDIQVASNFERFLFYWMDQQAEQVCRTMADFKTTGRVEFDSFENLRFRASRTSDSEILEITREVQDRFNYLCDPHTACGFKDLAEDMNSLILATAHPAKFPDALTQAVGRDVTHPTLEALKPKPIEKYQVEPTPEAIGHFIESHPACL